MKKKFVKLIKHIFDFIGRLTQDRIGVYTAQASFFMILSIFPFVLLLLNIIGLTPLEPATIINGINEYTPPTIRPLLIQIIEELYTHVSGTALSISAIVAVWSASKGVLSMMFGLYEIYKLHQNRNYFISRFISMAYTVVFLVAILVTMVLLVFGNNLFHLATSLIPALEEITVLTIILRYSSVFIILSMFFILIFRISNLKYATIRKVAPGAFLSALGWIIFSYVFSIYVDNVSDMSYMYGSLTAVIILMLWIYFCIYILFIGAEINKVLHPEIAQDVEH